MTSRSDFGRAMTGTNLKPNCAYFESKMLFRFFQHIFFKVLEKSKKL